MSYEKIAEYFPGRGPDAIRAHAYKKLRLNNSFKYRKHTKDESFWETPNPLNCYWGGFLAADGYICEKVGHEAVKVGLSIKDLKHLEKFKKDTKYTGIISQRKSRFKNKEKHPYTILVYIGINACKKWVADMKLNFNLCQRKTKILQGPNLTNDYLNLCFLIGYIDGDGCVHWDKWKKQPTIKFVSSSPIILNWVKDIFDRQFNFSARAPKKFNITKEPTMGKLSISGLRAAKVFELLSAIDIPKLDRKWKNPEFLAEFENYKLKFPTFFTKEAKQRLDIDGNLISPIFDDFRQLNALKIGFVGGTVSDDIKKSVSPSQPSKSLEKPTFSVAVTHSF